MTNLTHHQGRLERITRKWWFFGLFILLQFVVPPYASKGYKFPQEWGDVTYHALGNAIVYSHSQLYPIFKVIPIILLIGIIIFRNKVARLFSIYVSISYVLFAFGQSIAVTEKYGVAICTLNVIMFLIVAAFWFWEAIVKLSDFMPRKLPVWRYWVVPLAILAFWGPASRGGPDFNPVYLLTNSTGLAFCMMTPVYIGLLSLYWPKVNLATLRVTSLVGLIIGLYNVPYQFIFRPGKFYWGGILHIPLIVISLYGLIISFRCPRADKQTDSDMNCT